MSLIRQKTSLEINRELLDTAILGGAEAAHHFAVTLRNWNERIWSLPTEDLLELLNDDVPRTLAIFEANTAHANALNARLDALALPQFPGRAPTETGRADIAFENGQFVLVLPPEPESEPEEQP